MPVSLPILPRENEIGKGSVQRLFPLRRSLLPTKFPMHRLLRSVLKGIQCFFFFSYECLKYWKGQWKIFIQVEWMTPLFTTTRVLLLVFSLYSTTRASFEQLKQNNLKHLGEKKKKKKKIIKTHQFVQILKPGKTTSCGKTSCWHFALLTWFFHLKEFLFLCISTSDKVDEFQSPKSRKMYLRS